MDAMAFVSQTEELTPTPAPVPSEADRTLTITATYVLSEDGRKASLLGGGKGQAVQQVTLRVPANRLHLVSVDPAGVARLRLRPRYQLDGNERVVRIDAPPVYDTPPDIEELFRDAARNHQLERRYEAERRAAKEKRRESDRERRETLAQAFLNDPAQRALVHPPPTARRCYLASARGRELFDVNIDTPPGQEVPLEAHRRFRADLRARRERNVQQRAEQLALHEEKKRVIGEWIAAHGTPDQQARQAAGVLPMDEAIDAMTDQAFAVVASRPRYVHDGVARLQDHVRQHAPYADAIVTRDDLVVRSLNADTMTASQWALVNEFQALLSGATVTLRVHNISWKRDPHVTLPPIFGVLVTARVGPFTFRREYTAP
jgi:hypothetical protein